MKFIAAVLMMVTLCYSETSAKEPDMLDIYNAETGRAERSEKVGKADAEWKKILTPEEYEVTRKKGTERPFSGKCELPEKEGVYKCVCCGTDLFAVGKKFESGTGWPSFWEPVSNLNVRMEADNSGGMVRTEVLCARCGAHLGHVFDDGPAPTGLRYCINSISLKFTPVKPVLPSKAAFGAGCFWGVEEAFRTIPGVISTRVGYAGGKYRNPTYKDVCTGRTGHAETVEVEYEASRITYEELLKAFWAMHDPTTPDRQGPDVGTQYRSVIFYYDDDQRAAATALKEEFDGAGKYRRPIVTQIVPAGVFWPAEEYHQKYVLKGGRAACHRPE